MSALMRRLQAAALLLSLTGCAADAATVAPPAVPPAPPASALPSAQSSAPAPSAVSQPSPAPELSYLARYRQVLEQMVEVDTSHGGETKLLEPIAALYRDAGVPVQILESAPGRGNLVARLKGSGAKKPLLLLAHVDVVPVEGQPWTVPPFAVTEKDGFLWGRGINDDKSMAAAIVALTLELAHTRAPLTRDVIVALTSGEETGGSAGARWLCEKHPELLDAEIALNEGGGAQVTDDLAKPVAFGVGVSEKIFQTFGLEVKGKGGHSSRPPTSGDPVVALARALVKIGEYRFPAKLLPEEKAYYEAELPYAAKEYVAAMKHAIASAPRIAPADDAVLVKDAGYNSGIRTTCVTTMLEGSPQDNVLPTTAKAKVNCRILPGETRAQVKATLEKLIADTNVVVTQADDFGDAAASPFEGEVVDAVRKAVQSRFPGTPVVPGLSSGTTDSRFLRTIGIKAYGVSPGMGSRAEGAAGHGAHGPDERKPIKWMDPGAEYFREVVRTLVL
jgi:acetylornithine deacetylase/succinyl-diaminopimelate desuccinylase-like protein